MRVFIRFNSFRMQPGSNFNFYKVFVEERLIEGPHVGMKRESKVSRDLYYIESLIAKSSFIWNIFFCFFILFILLVFFNIITNYRYLNTKNVQKFNETLLKFCVSHYETTLYIGSFLVIVLGEIFLSFVSDELSDTFIFHIFLFVIISLILNFLIITAVKFFSLLSSTSTTSINFKLFLIDVLNHFLCLVRISMCAFRYILYDLQVEYIDMSLQYTENIILLIDPLSDPNNVFFYKIVFTFFDFVFAIFSILINFFKYGIASFLLWLILDLFLLRVSLNKSEKDLIESIYKI